MAAVAADMFEAKNFSNLPHWQSLAWHGAPRDHEGETVPWLDDCAREPHRQPLVRGGWNVSELVAGFRRNHRL